MKHVRAIIMFSIVSLGSTFLAARKATHVRQHRWCPARKTENWSRSNCRSNEELARSGNIVILSAKNRGEPLNPDLIAGDLVVILAATCYQQLVSILLDESFQGWGSPVVDESFANVPAVVGDAALWGLLWVFCGTRPRHRVFSAIYATSTVQLLHTGVDAACLRVGFELLRVVATHEPTKVAVLLSSNADNVIWLLAWRYIRSQSTPF